MILFINFSSCQRKEPEPMFLFICWNAFLKTISQICWAVTDRCSPSSWSALHNLTYIYFRLWTISRSLCNRFRFRLLEWIQAHTTLKKKILIFLEVSRSQRLQKMGGFWCRSRILHLISCLHLSLTRILSGLLPQGKQPPSNRQRRVSDWGYHGTFSHDLDYRMVENHISSHRQGCQKPTSQSYKFGLYSR